MSNIDKRALREAAEKATSGKWERGDGNGNGGELLVYCDDALGSAVCEMTSEYNAIPKYQRINNLNFIAAANPATVLALLDELEDYKAAYEEESRDKEVQRYVIDDALCKLLPGCQYMDLPDGGSVTPLEQVSRMIADYSEQLQAAEKRVAELSHHLECAHVFIEHTEAFGHAASNGILCCGDAQWNIDASKSALAAAGKGE